MTRCAFAWPDPVIGNPVYLQETVRGTDDAARRTARRALNCLVAEAEKAPAVLGGLPRSHHRRVAEGCRARGQHSRDLRGLHRAHDQTGSWVNADRQAFCAFSKPSTRNCGAAASGVTVSRLSSIRRPASTTARWRSVDRACACPWRLPLSGRFIRSSAAHCRRSCGGSGWSPILRGWLSGRSRSP